MRTTGHLTRARRIGNAPKRPINGHMIVRRCRAGAALCKSYGPTGVRFSLQPPGVRIKPKYARAAIASGKLMAVRDGLFGTSQTWIAKPPHRLSRKPIDAQRCPRAIGVRRAASGRRKRPHVQTK